MHLHQNKLSYDRYELIKFLVHSGFKYGRNNIWLTAIINHLVIMLMIVEESVWIQTLTWQMYLEFIWYLRQIGFGLFICLTIWLKLHILYVYMVYSLSVPYILILQIIEICFAQQEIFQCQFLKFIELIKLLWVKCNVWWRKLYNFIRANMLSYIL